MSQNSDTEGHCSKACQRELCNLSRLDSTSYKVTAGTFEPFDLKAVRESLCVAQQTDCVWRRGWDGCYAAPEAAADESPCVSVIGDPPSMQVHFPAQSLESAIIPDRSKLRVDGRVNQDGFVL